MVNSLHFIYSSLLFSEDQLKGYLELAKFQVPTTRTRALNVDGEKPSTSEGSTPLEKKEILPTTPGRERFGAGTKGWPMHDLTEECLKDFMR